jgi:enoyl-CoA hydratase/carnithine racemase
MATTADAPVITTRASDGVCVVELNRPEKLNALNEAMVSTLHRELQELALDTSCRVVVLTGRGRGFCAGLDLFGYGTAPGSDPADDLQSAFQIQRHIASLVGRLRSLPQPVVAAVNGPAAGGGLALVLGSDIRLAGASATFSAAFMKVGVSNCDIGVSWLLPRLVGAARAQELLLTARTFDAREAAEIGVVVETVDDDRLAARADEVARSMLGFSPFALAQTKEGMWNALETPTLQLAVDFENRQQIMLSTSGDLDRAREAFASRGG